MTQPDTDPDLDRLAQTLREMTLSFVRATRSPSMSRTAAATLGRLERHGAARVTDLARAEVATQPAMTGLVQRLEQSGLVARRPDPDDARASLIEITDTGRAALAARRAEQDAVIAGRLGALPPDQLDALRAVAPVLTTLTQEIHADR